MAPANVRKCPLCKESSDISIPNLDDEGHEKIDEDGNIIYFSVFIHIGNWRMTVLKRWYPDDIRSHNQYIHKRCLVSLGLYPLPENDIPINEAMGRAVTARIATIAAEYPEIKAPNMLINRVFEIIRAEYRIPTDDGVHALRWMVAHWISTRLADGRGNVPAYSDTVSAIEHTEPPAVNLRGGLFYNVVEIGAPPTSVQTDAVSGSDEMRRRHLIAWALTRVFQNGPVVGDNGTKDAGVEPPVLSPPEDLAHRRAPEDDQRRPAKRSRTGRLRSIPPNVHRILNELAVQPSIVRNSTMEISDREVQGMLLRFRTLGREHLDVPPVYLGRCAQFRIVAHAPRTNLRVLISSTKMKCMIIRAFKHMSPSAYELHELRGFFEPNPDPERYGYVPKMVTFPRGREIMFDVDHIIPTKWDRRCAATVVPPPPAGGTIPVTTPSCTAA